MFHRLKKMHLTAYFITVLMSSVRASAVKVRGKRGMSVSLDTREDSQKDSHIVWLFGRDKPTMRIASLNDGEVKTDYVDSFRDRLQLDSLNGSLTITDLRISDCGIYLGQIINTKISSHTFHLTVYSFVSPPNIKTLASLVNGSCSLTVECSVANGREVILAWYRGEERLSQTSSSDLSVLSLPLEIKDHDGDIYSCVAENPVDKTATKLHTEEACLKSGECTWCCQKQATVRLVISAVVGVALIVLLVDHFRPRRCPKHSP
ncbi:hepatocyte cell adhesion molecule-like [Myripristis murdjan]|uniref:hepatocyte cell adhesion molecule-like n=1 Tax=Myripristis murdjan TaxID=586833 RepID=UPI001176219C|nr:hepatocyte cell adhesion molecule-like [Myripristis murdjan]